MRPGTCSQPSSADDIARATLRHAAAIVGSRDGLIAFTNDGRGSADGDTPMMRQLAGMGTFEETGLSIRPGEGFWGRLWSNGGVLAEDEGGNGVLLGVPIPVDGQVSGVVGVGLPAAAAVSPERIRMLDHLAALAGAAVQRLTPPTGDGG